MPRETGAGGVRRARPGERGDPVRAEADWPRWLGAPLHLAPAASRAARWHARTARTRRSSRPSGAAARLRASTRSQLCWRSGKTFPSDGGSVGAALFFGHSAGSRAPAARRPAAAVEPRLCNVACERCSVIVASGVPCGLLLNRTARRAALWGRVALGVDSGARSVSRPRRACRPDAPPSPSPLSSGLPNVGLWRPSLWADLADGLVSVDLEHGFGRVLSGPC